MVTGGQDVSVDLHPAKIILSQTVYEGKGGTSSERLLSLESLIC